MYLICVGFYLDMNSMGILLLSEYFNFLEMSIQLESSLFA